MKSSIQKIIPWIRLAAWRAELKKQGRTLVVTNGCFDLLHVGHVTYLVKARNLGDALLVGVNSDRAVRILKGPDRPIHDEDDRALVLSGLESVDGVCIFDDNIAADFLTIAEPDIYVKGGDYTEETLNPFERAVLKKCRSGIAIIPLVEGKSTSATLERLQSA